jgi:hypothetical protein
MMVMPLIGAAARMAAKKLAEKGGKKTVKKAAKKGMSAEDARLVGVSGLSALGSTNLLLGQDDYIKERDERKAAKEREAKDEIKRETRGMKKGGKVESKLMKKGGRGMAKATMQKVASKVVRGHEKRMHKMNSGGSIDGIALRGHTVGKKV